MPCGGTGAHENMVKSLDPSCSFGSHPMGLGGKYGLEIQGSFGGADVVRHGILQGGHARCPEIHCQDGLPDT